MPWEQSELGGERALRRRRRRRRRTRAEAQDKKAQGYNAPQSAFYFPLLPRSLSPLLVAFLSIGEGDRRSSGTSKDRERER